MFCPQASKRPETKKNGSSSLVSVVILVSSQRSKLDWLTAAQTSSRRSSSFHLFKIFPPLLFSNAQLLQQNQELKTVSTNLILRLFAEKQIKVCQFLVNI